MRFVRRERAAREVIAQCPVPQLQAALDGRGPVPALRVRQISAVPKIHDTLVGSYGRIRTWLAFAHELLTQFHDGAGRSSNSAGHRARRESERSAAVRPFLDRWYKIEPRTRCGPCAARANPAESAVGGAALTLSSNLPLRRFDYILMSTKRVPGILMLASKLLISK